MQEEESMLGCSQ